MWHTAAHARECCAGDTRRRGASCASARRGGLVRVREQQQACAPARVRRRARGCAAGCVPAGACATCTTGALRGKDVGTRRTPWAPTRARAWNNTRRRTGDDASPARVTVVHGGIGRPLELLHGGALGERGVGSGRRALCYALGITLLSSSQSEFARSGKCRKQTLGDFARAKDGSGGAVALESRDNFARCNAQRRAADVGAARRHRARSCASPRGGLLSGPALTTRSPPRHRSALHTGRLLHEGTASTLTSVRVCAEMGTLARVLVAACVALIRVEAGAPPPRG